MPEAFRAQLLSARREVLIVNAYIIPDAVFVDDLRALTARGVTVRVLTNSIVEGAVVPGVSAAGFPIAGSCNTILGTCTCPPSQGDPPILRTHCQSHGRSCGDDGGCALLPHPAGPSAVATCGRFIWFRSGVVIEGVTTVLEGTKFGRGFQSDRSLVSLGGFVGGPFALAEQQGAGGAAWGSDDRIVFAPIYSEGLFRVSVEGGEPERLTTPNRAEGELGHWWPQILPGGQAILFTAFRSPVVTSRVGVVYPHTGELKVLVEGGMFGRYVPSGHLLYVRGDRLLAAPFDGERAVVTGPAKSVLDDLFVSPTEALTLLDVSANGTLAWLPGSVADPPRELVWVERAGRTRPAIPELRRYRGAGSSPDGRSLVTAIIDDNLDLWTYSLDRGTSSRLTVAG